LICSRSTERRLTKPENRSLRDSILFAQHRYYGTPEP
jgi:hypothetical protein